MREEAWTEAAKAFQQAIDIDREHEGAYYGLGLSSLRQKKYPDAIAAYLKCRDLYSAQAGKQFSNRQDAQRYRQDRLTEIDDIIRQYQSGPQTAGSQDRLRQLNQQRRDIQEYISRGNNLTVENSVPAFVYLALGSAYFRTQQWADAEREYKAAIAADPKSGEAFNNLAVVYLQTGRPKEAEAAVTFGGAGRLQGPPGAEGGDQSQDRVSAVSRRAAGASRDRSARSPDPSP